MRQPRVMLFGRWPIDVGLIGTPDGDLDPRIVAFYGELRGEFPDYPPYHDAPWMEPLGTGIDHVTMQLSFGSESDRAIDRIMELAEQHDLVVFDPQDGGVHVPSVRYLPSGAGPV
jgi:hypothetical protein